VDLLLATRIHSLPLGVNRTTGMCVSRPGSDPDVAYSISEQTILTVQTAQLFPSGYPQDFSLLLVVSPTRGKALHDTRYPTSDTGLV
jgi:collagen type V/XI/XXIV/XXVII alpha